MASECEIYCVGCGISITPTNRRALASLGAENIVQVWMAILRNEEQAVQDVLSVEDRKICRKCFSAYDRYSKLHDTIQDNMRKAAEVFGVAHTSRSPIVHPVPKRCRLSSRPDNQQMLQRSGNGGTSQSSSNAPTHSPDVAVCKCID